MVSESRSEVLHGSHLALGTVTRLAWAERAWHRHVGLRRLPTQWVNAHEPGFFLNFFIPRENWSMRCSFCASVPRAGRLATTVFTWAMI
jgi:hypothetical protein